jgi:YVTN family beta-propeller protein
MIILSLALATCLAGSTHAASVERLYAVSFNGSLIPPGTGLVNDTGNVTGNVYLYQIDTDRARVLSALCLDEPAYFMVASPSGERLYLTGGRSRNVTVVDPLNLSITGKFSLNGSVGAIALSPDGLKLYALLPDRGEICILDAVNGTAGGVIRVNNTPCDLAIAPDGKWIYAVDSNNDSVAVIDVAINRQTTIIHTGARPVGVTAYPGSRTLYVANYGNNTVSVYDAADFTLKTVTFNVIRPSCVVADLPQSWIFVTSLSDGNLTRVDVAGNTVTAVKQASASALGKPVVSADGVNIFVPDNGQKSIIIMSAATLLPAGAINFTDPVMALAIAAGAAKPEGVIASPSPVPRETSTSVPTPVYTPGNWGTPTPFYIPLPIPPKVSPIALSDGQGIFGHNDNFPYIVISPVTQNDIIFILLIFIIVLVVLAGITYIMMFRNNDDDDDD